MNLLFLFLAFVSLICVALAQPETPRKIVLKVNLGGGPVGDFLGEDQVLETEGLHKTTTKEAIENTDQQEVFQSQRFARDEDFVMRIPVPDGIYSLTLLFAEIYNKACVPGGRVFDISLGTPISGVAKIEDFDVFQAAGCNAAHGKRFDKVPSKDGIVIHLARKSQHPSLSGFIVEGFPLPKGDGSEYRAVGQPQPEPVDGGSDSASMEAAAPGASLAGMSAMEATGMPLPGAQPVGEPLGGASAGGLLPMDLTSAGSHLEGAPTSGGPPRMLEGAPPGGIPGEAVVGNEQITTNMQPVGPDPVATEGQQMMHMGQQPQAQSRGMDIGQSQINIGPDSMGAQPGQVPHVPNNQEMVQQPLTAGPMGAQQPPYRMRRA